MYINTFRYKPEDVDCKLCTEYRKKLGCTVKGCPFLAERIEAGVVGYGDAVQNTLAHHTALDPRLTALIRLFPGTMWADARHKPRMEAFKARQGYRRHRDTPAYYAAMYLLTANEDLHRRTANCFCKRGLEFAYALLRGIAPHDYPLFVAARDLFTGADGLTFTDLADPGVVDAVAFRLVVNALLVVRYGPVILDIRERGHGA